MTEVESLINSLRGRQEVIQLQQDDGGSVRFAFRNTFNPPQARSEVINLKGFPRGLIEFWGAANGARLFEEVNYGQWGLVLYGFPEMTQKDERLKVTYVDQLHHDDLIVGEFLGDTDIPLVCNNPSSPDFGAVFVALPTYPRDEWYKVADDLIEFLERFVVRRGEKYWE